MRSAARPRHPDRDGRRLLAASFLPLLGDGMDGGAPASQALMHRAVAAVLIPGLGGGSPEAGSGAAMG
ncbi:hypothetical protein ACGF8D_24265 [Streptomyces massasporeus]|uniref:hypothetical protein n=1 Tax=Streptomyces massasporeus TaxID=67324 RepID=UPI00371D8F9E